MKHAISILDFDHVYNIQSYFKGSSYEWIDFSDIKNISRYCEKGSLININQRLKKRNNTGITFIGSGNYHYITYLLMSEIQSPFTLVLFDYHTDMLKPYFGTLMSCGSWVLKALQGLPMLKKVVIIGVKKDLANIIPPYYNEVVSVFTEERIRKTEEVVELNKYINLEIPTKNVYISIDKDVLSTTEAVTNWDQGSMKLGQLLNLVEYISITKKICGVDICGEYPFNPVTSFYKENLKATEKNNKANKKILNIIEELNI